MYKKLNKVISGISRRVDFRAFLPGFSRSLLRWVAYHFIYREWLKRRYFPPPHVVKVKTIESLARKYKITTLIETGTYYGDTLDCLKNKFDTLYSIELSRKFYLRAKNIFRKNNNIKLIYGDSGIKLIGLLKKIKEPVVFWLDAHYSGGGTAKGTKNTPVLNEVINIHKFHPYSSVILIDDAREFVGKKSYPKLAVFEKKVRVLFPNHKVVVKNDVLCILPNKIIRSPK